jgi:NodT family efflux transporter outer membrane factor (OMF) lipoprotein
MSKMENAKSIVKNLIITATVSSAMILIFSAGALAEDVAPVSRDADLDAGKWSAISAKYPNPYASGDIFSGAVAPSSDVLANWWDVLEDETLTRLIEWSLLDNRDLQAARSKVVESRASLGISKSALLPWLDNVDSWTHSETSENSTSAGAKPEISHLGIDASWEIDIFGGRHQDIKAGVAALEADYAALHSAWVSLSSEVALNYLTLRTLQERLAISQQNLELQQETVDLLQSRYDAGLVDALALSQARYTIEQTRAGIPPLQANIEAAMNALSILTGSIPGSLEEMLKDRKPLPSPDPVSLVGIPANSLRQRPDIRAAERRLAAQVARKKSAEADLLPRFYLTGSIGLESLSGGSLFSSDSFGFSFGPRITLPIFHGEAIRSNIRVQGAREEQLLAAYEGTVLGAVAEVRNALASSAQEIDRNKSLKIGIAAARDALEVAVDKYKSGLTDFNNVITAQRALLTLEEETAISDGQMTSNVVRVFKALGGGWAPLLAENQEEAVTSVWKK